jgi:hypothetical protein
MLVLVMFVLSARVRIMACGTVSTSEKQGLMVMSLASCDTQERFLLDCHGEGGKLGSCKYGSMSLIHIVGTDGCCCFFLAPELEAAVELVPTAFKLSYAVPLPRRRNTYWRRGGKRSLLIRMS